MFDIVREKKRFVQIVLALIILPFALWGVSSYDQSGNSAEVVATVNGTKITQQEFDNALRQQQERMREKLGASFDAAMFDNPGMKRAILENLVTQRLLIERAKAARLVVTDEHLAQVIAGVEAFQEDGKFDGARYASVLQSNNMTPLVYERRLRDELLGHDIQVAYAQNGYSPNVVAERIYRLTEQQRMVRVYPVSFQSFMAQAKIDESAQKQYYDQNQGEFQVPEQVRVEYVKFSMDDLLARAEVSKEEARSYYESNQSEFGAAEERQAAHILVSVTAAASSAERDAAKARAERLLQQVRQKPSTFAEIAKRESQDPGSAANGGDLGFFARGAMVKPFEDAAFSMKAGEISELVRSDFGFHIIKLIAVRPSRVPPFDEVREGIVNKIRQQKAADMFTELAERFSNTVYEQSDTLKPAAELAGVKIEQSGWLTKGMAGGVPWTSAMLQAIFSEDALVAKRNTAAIEVETDTLVSARVLEHRQTTVRPLNEVKETIRQKLARQHAMELAAKQGKGLLDQLRNGNKPALNWGKPQSITRLQYGSLDAALAKQVFQVNPDRLPQYVGAQDGSNGYVLVSIDSVKEVGVPSDATLSRYARQLRQLTGEEMFQAYLAEEKQQATINMSLPEKDPE